MAQSAFLCSLFETVCSARSESVLGAPSDFDGAAGWTDSGLTLSDASNFDGVWPSLPPFCPVISFRPRTDAPANGRYGNRRSCLRHGGQEVKGECCRERARFEEGLSMSLASILLQHPWEIVPYVGNDAQTPMALSADGWL